MDSELGKGDLLRAFWFPNSNFGDHLNFYLLSRICRDRLTFTDITSAQQKIVAIGSILGWCSETCVAWGPGLGNATDCVNPGADIRAVRGPRSYQRAVECGCKLEPVFGDPALLLPLVYQPQVRKQHRLGLLPHYVDQLTAFAAYARADDIHLINVLAPPEEVIDAIASCEAVVSSSLHGIIAAHAYNVPAAWAEFGGKIEGDGFKYHDHFEAVGCKVDGPTDLRDLPSLAGILQRARLQLELTPLINTDQLLAAAPFRSHFSP